MQEQTTAKWVLHLWMVVVCAAPLLAWVVIPSGPVCEGCTPIGPNAGSTDFIEWKEVPGGLMVTGIHPLLRNALSGQQLPVSEGDILIQVDYLPAGDILKHRNELNSAEPGRVFIYTFHRPSGTTSSRTFTAFFIARKVPSFCFAETGFSWNAAFYFLLAASVASVVLIVILFPILRSAIQEQFPRMLTLLAGLVLIFLSWLRMAALLLDHELMGSAFESAFTHVFPVLGIVFAASFFAARTRGAERWALLPFGATWAWAVYQVGFPVSGNTSFVSEASWTLALCVQVFTIAVAEYLRPEGAFTRMYHGLFGIHALLVSGVFVFTFLPEPEGKSPGLYEERARLLLMLSLFLPILMLALRQLKFGKVNVVLTRTLVMTLGGIIAVLFFVLIAAVTDQFAADIAYKNVLDVSLLVIIVILMVGMYRAFEDRIGQLVTLKPSAEEARFQEFIEHIPRYTSSKQLLADLPEETGAYFGAEAIIFPDQQAAGAFPDPGLLETWFQQSAQPWSSIKELVPSKAPEEVEAMLSASGFSLVIPMLLQDSSLRLLCFGPKRSGVFNLSDIERLSRIVQQCKLTINVLHLLERERLLMQKNYEANLTILRSQINPHFLFNTLNTISALIHDAPDLAEQAVEKLAFIFRYTLKTSSQSYVPLPSEFSLVRTYLEIEQIRFGKRLQVTIDDPTPFSAVYIPALVLQTIIENCIKHGIAKIIGQGIVSIGLEDSGDDVLVKVYDNGPGIQQDRILKGTGLNNITTRIREIYQDADRIRFENTGNGTMVTLRLPKAFQPES